MVDRTGRETHTELEPATGAVSSGEEMKNRLATVLLLAGSGPCVSARWLRWSANEQPTIIPRETGAVPVSAGQGWTPKPTPPPGARKSDQDRVVEYLGVAKKLQNLLNVPIPNLRHVRARRWF